jgi:hypothetical protein
MPKFAVVQDDGTTIELDQESYGRILHDAIASFITTPEFTSTFDKISETCITKTTASLEAALVGVNQRIGAVEKATRDQGEMIEKLTSEQKTLVTRCDSSDSRHAELTKKMEDLAKEVRMLSAKAAEKPTEAMDFESRPSSLSFRVPYEPSQPESLLYPKMSRPMVDSRLLSTFPDFGSLQEDFGKLLQAKSRTRLQVVMGPILTKNDGVDGRPKADELTPISDEEVSAVLDAVGVKVNYAITVMNAEKRIVKIRFEGFAARDARDSLLSAWKPLNEEHGVWISPDQPVDLSKMEWNAKKFGITLRKSHAAVGNPYVTVQDGVLLIGATPIAPVYLIPEPDKWPVINPIVLEALSGNKDLPWAKRKLRVQSGSLATKIWDAIWAQDLNHGSSTI